MADRMSHREAWRRYRGYHHQQLALLKLMSPNQRVKVDYSNAWPRAIKQPVYVSQLVQNIEDHQYIITAVYDDEDGRPVYIMR